MIISLKRGLTDPTASNLAPFEIGWGRNNKRLFINDNGTIVRLNSKITLNGVVNDDPSFHAPLTLSANRVLKTKTSWGVGADPFEFIAIDGTVTASSGNLITSGAVNTAITNLQSTINTALNLKANDNQVLKLTGNQIVEGTKLFYDLVANDRIRINSANAGGDANRPYLHLHWPERSYGNYSVDELGRPRFGTKSTPVISDKILATVDQIPTLDEVVKINDIAQVYGGKNLARLDLRGKEYLGNGIYALLNVSTGLYTYNIYTGEHVLNGSFAGTGLFNFMKIEYSGTLFVKSYLISGTKTNSGAPYLYNIGSAMNFNNILSGVERDVKGVRSVGWDLSGSFDNFTFKLQIEKGTTATPYTVPGQIPQYKIVGEE